MRNNLRHNRHRIIDLVRQKDPKAAEALTNLRLDWYSIKNKDGGSTDEANVYIYDEIMPQWMAEWIGGGVSAEGMIAELNEITAGTINLRINSPGGSVFEAIAIYNALVSHSAEIHVFVDALAASAASVIAMAGDKITMMVGSQMMIHDAIGMEYGNAADMRAYAKFLDGQSDNLASIYAARTGGDVADWRALMVAETWMTASEAVQNGIADEVYTKSAASDPPQEDPKEDPEEDPDKTKEPDPTDPEEEEEAATGEDPENKLKRRHNLQNRGFKYAGRRRAPGPDIIDLNREVDEILASLGAK